MIGERRIRRHAIPEGMRVQAAAGTTFLQSLSGSLSGFSGAITKRTNKNLEGQLKDTIFIEVWNGSVTKRTSKLLSGALGAWSGACATAATFRKTLTGALGGISGGFSGALSTLFIANPANLINILQRLRKRGDL